MPQTSPQLFTPSVEAFWNDLYASGKIPVAEESVVRAASNYFGDMHGKTVLDIGCGLGATSLWFAARGADVIAIDISETAINQLNAFCAENNVENVRAIACSAFDIGNFAPIDLVFGNCILHHLEPFDQFVDLLHRTMPVNGKAFFHENSGAVTFLMWARANVVGRFGIPRLGDGVEYPLTPGEIEMLRKKFTVAINVPFMMFFRLAGIYLFRRRFGRFLGSLDNLAYRLPPLRRLSYFQDLLLTRT